jgi:multicomponent Na+:H+ antiporter subunit E
MRNRRPRRPRTSGLGAWSVLFVVSLGFWFVMSGHYDLLHVGSGVLSSAVVASLTLGVERRGHLFASRHAGAPEHGPLFRVSAAWGRFLVYLPWLLYQMLKSALQVAGVVVHPRMPIDPVLVRLPVRLSGDLPLTTFGNSITLTPGTVTVDVEGREFVVHALTRAAAEDLRSGAMESRVAWTFGQPRS